ncbi:DinB family protein [Arcticibacter eurypsychrophilus]|uniref:DinB family protein n=1 Tax=Arcticibacter eurypsychrophilus TaxID=1434752 RepID=UPI00084D0226|nr:DinB family protein [Arcticibacter eurypsychrophilus]
MDYIRSKDIVAELTQLIKKGNAHVSFEEAVEGLPPELRTKIVYDLPYSIWQLTEHIRITQWDILQFCKSSDHVSPKWPDEYWPGTVNEVDDTLWNSSLEQIKADRLEFFELLNNSTLHFVDPIPYGDGQTLLREAMVIADHTSYHIGQIIIIRRLLHDWKS